MIKIIYDYVCLAIQLSLSFSLSRSVLQCCSQTKRRLLKLDYRKMLPNFPSCGCMCVCVRERVNEVGVFP